MLDGMGLRWVEGYKPRGHGQVGAIREAVDTYLGLHQGLADRLERVLSNGRKRKEMGQESLRIAARHDAEGTLDAFEEIYAMVTEPDRVHTCVPPTPKRNPHSANPRKPDPGNYSILLDGTN